MGIVYLFLCVDIVIKYFSLLKELIQITKSSFVTAQKPMILYIVAFAL